MAKNQVCGECGYRNYARAWDCARCNRTTRYAKLRTISFVVMFVVVAGGYFFIQSVVKSELPG
jgi:ribosomal protein L40E